MEGALSSRHGYTHTKRWVLLQMRLFPYVLAPSGAAALLVARTADIHPPPPPHTLPEGRRLEPNHADVLFF